jgi:hypothetical protein
MIRVLSNKSFLRIIYILLVTFTTFNVIAQVPKKNIDEVTDDQISLFYKKAQSSGMSEADIEKAAITQGYSAAEIARVRERISKMQLNNSSSTSVQAVDNSRRTLESSDKKASQVVAADVPKVSSSIFGESLFANSKMSFEPDLRIATPKNYQLGPDDELNIDIFGEVLDNFKVKVSLEGTVKI